MARDWNYIHPDFRGPNRTFDSMGSQFVLSDIEDAIEFALKNTHADPNNVHIIGVSGGGFATLGRIYEHCLSCQVFFCLGTNFGY